MYKNRFTNIAPKFSPFKRRRRGVLWASSVSSFILLCMWIVIPFLARARATAGTRDGVEVVSEHSVGVYDVQVVRSDEADKLIEWLNRRWPGTLSFDRTPRWKNTENILLSGIEGART